MLPRIVISSNHTTQGAELTARLWFFVNENDSAVLISKKASGNFVEIDQCSRTKLPKPIRKHDSSAIYYVYTKTNDSAVYKITH